MQHRRCLLACVIAAHVDRSVSMPIHWRPSFTLATPIGQYAAPIQPYGVSGAAAKTYPSTNVLALGTRSILPL